LKPEAQRHLFYEIEKIWLVEQVTDVVTFNVLGIDVLSTMSIKGKQWFDIFMKPIWHTQLPAINVLFAIREQLGTEAVVEVGLPVVTNIGMIGLTIGIPRFVGGFCLGVLGEVELGEVWYFIVGRSALERIEAYCLMAEVSTLEGKKADILTAEELFLEVAYD
jgi:hypothetical protein